MGALPRLIEPLGCGVSESVWYYGKRICERAPACGVCLCVCVCLHRLSISKMCLYFNNICALIDKLSGGHTYCISHMQLKLTSTHKLCLCERIKWKMILFLVDSFLVFIVVVGAAASCCCRSELIQPHGKGAT